ncbi:MAG TPA: DUF2783 domain-containing protein [Paracoccaceae bacterium]|nr:DUF2783 domain-containing protein [Paracoccaceae bacterium]
MSLVTEPNLDDPDGLYDALLRAHQGLSEAESAALDARLVLVLMNHAGEDAAREALALALAAGGEDAG